MLELKNLSVHYGPKRVVHDVNLVLQPGQTLGLAGESGSGKSTVAMSVLRLLPRTAHVEGEILLDGDDVRTMSWGRLRAVRWASASIVFQGAMHSLNPVQRVGEQIAEPMRLHGAGGSVGELLEQVELPPDTAREVLRQLKPKIAIPMHYRESTYLLDMFVKGYPNKYLGRHTMTFSKAALPQPTQIVVFTPWGMRDYR